jgi:hypothetical protein
MISPLIVYNGAQVVFTTEKSTIIIGTPNPVGGKVVKIEMYASYSRTIKNNCVKLTPREDMTWSISRSRVLFIVIENP